MSEKIGKRKWKVVLRAVPIIVGITLIGWGAWRLCLRIGALMPGAPPSSDVVTTHSTSEPSEHSFDIGDYRVAPDVPRLLTIERVGIGAIIQRVDIDQYGAIAVPATTRAVGWYVQSAKPGEHGLSIIDGHVRGIYTDGVFADLDSVVQNDTITVTYGDSTERHFRVRKTMVVSAGAADEVLFTQLPNVTSQLNLITCTGAYDDATKTYNNRLIVMAERT